MNKPSIYLSSQMSLQLIPINFEDRQHLEAASLQDVNMPDNNTTPPVTKEKSYPYTLTLKAVERRAIDWIGDRYDHGRDLYLCLTQAEWWPDDLEWDCDEDIEFLFEEWLAFNVQDLLADCNYECFGDELKEKLLTFVDSIV